MKNKTSILALLLVYSLTGGSAGAASFSSFYVFGDSLSDSGANPSSVLSMYKLLGGNCPATHSCTPYFEGRFSNGPTAVEYMADAILPGGATTSNFFNFAVSGATTGIGNYGDGGTQTTSGFPGLPGMAQQLGLFSIDPQYINQAGTNPLFLVWGGANDYLTEDSAADAAKKIVSYVGELASMGASNIIVPNLPDLSLTPYVQLKNDQTAAKNFSIEFNQTLASQIDALSGALPSANIVQFDTFSLFNNIIQNPANYGFTNTTEACVVLLIACTDDSTHVFWDDFHPTTQVHMLVAAAIVSQVPLPGALVLFISGLMGVFLQGYRRNS